MSNASLYRDKTADELSDELNKLKKEQFNLRFQRASGQLEKTNRVRDVRRDIARVQTVLGQQLRGEIATKAGKKSAGKAKAPAKRSAKSKV